MECRKYQGIEEHKHDGHNQWHPANRIHRVVCNFQYFNGLVKKCNLKVLSPKSADEYPTCDEHECILMRLLSND